MFKKPKASLATASIAGLLAGALVTLITVSQQALGEGVLSGIVSLLAGGAVLALAVAYVGDYGRLMRAGGWGSAAQWYLHASLFLICLLAAWMFLDTQIVPLLVPR
jgi:hypothetical protein